MEITHTVEVHKPPEAIFPWIAEPSKAIQWQNNVKEGEVIHRSPEVVGTSFRETIEEDGNTLEMQGLITTYQENRRIGFRLESKIHTVEVVYLVEPLDTRAKVTMQARIAWKFPLNLMSVFMGRKMKAGILQQTELEFRELKRLCETSK
jgi:hypothetical protein